MIDVSDLTASILARSHVVQVRAQSWLDDQLLADDVPIAGGSESVDRSLRVPDSVQLTIPRIDRGTNWSPLTADHPLSANGQRLSIQLGVSTANGLTEWIQRGWFVVGSSQVSGDSVQVTGAGMLTLIDEAQLTAPFQPGATDTLVSTLRSLVEPALTIHVDPALIDRAVPAGINYDQDRLAAVLGVLDAWPADAAMTPDGYLNVFPAVQSSTPVLTLTDGAGGTVVHASGSSTRDGGFTLVVAQGTAPDGGQVQGLAYVSLGPRAYGGPFNPLPVPSFFSSPLLTTVAQCAAAAQTVRDRQLRALAPAYTVEMVPDPRIQTGDCVQLVADEITGPCSVEAYTMPYTADGGSMQLTVAALS